MELLEGETVKELLNRKGPLSYQETEKIICAVLATLSEVHQSGIIHRDISPDNIYLTKSGEIKIIDFGAARYASTYHSKSLSVILKPGYAPEEQYRSRGNQGSWSDIYAVAATMYKMLTGVTPQESMDRMTNDQLKEPSKLGVVIDKKNENSLMNALNISAGDRTQTAEQFLEELTGNTDVDRKKIIQKKKDEGKWPLWLKLAAAAVPVVIGVVAILLFSGESMGIPIGYVTAPNVLQMSEQEAKRTIEASNLYMVVAGTTNVDFGESGRVQDCDIEVGSLVKQYQTMNVWLSINEGVFMPNILFWNEENARVRLEEAGLNMKVDYVESDEYADGTIIEQEFPEGEILSRNKLVTVKAMSIIPTESFTDTT